MWRLVAVLAVAGLVVFAAVEAPSWSLWARSDPGMATLTGAGAVGLLLVAGAWRLSRFAVTVVHELGHALCAALVGGRPVRISMAMDTSGLATWTAPARWRVRRSVVAVSGYLAPPAAGLAGLAAVAAGNAYPWLVVTATLFAATLFVLARSVVAVAVTFAVAGSALAVTVWVPQAAGAATVALASVWLLGGVRSAYEHARTKDLSRSDAGTVRSELFIPARVVAWTQLLLSCVALAGAWLVLWHTR